MSEPRATLIPTESLLAGCLPAVAARPDRPAAGLTRALVAERLDAPAARGRNACPMARIVSAPRATLIPTEYLLDRRFAAVAPRASRQLIASVALSGLPAGALDTPAPSRWACVT